MSTGEHLVGVLRVVNTSIRLSIHAVVVGSAKTDKSVYIVGIRAHGQVRCTRIRNHYHVAENFMAVENLRFKRRVLHHAIIVIISFQRNEIVVLVSQFSAFDTLAPCGTLMTIIVLIGFRAPYNYNGSSTT